MIVTLENTQQIVLHQVELFFTLLLVIHQRNAREAGWDYAQGQDRCFGCWSSRHLCWTSFCRSSFRNGRSDWHFRFQKASCWYPTLLRCVWVDYARTCRIALDKPPTASSWKNYEGIPTIFWIVRKCAIFEQNLLLTPRRRIRHLVLPCKDR